VIAEERGGELGSAFGASADERARCQHRCDERFSGPTLDVDGQLCHARDSRKRDAASPSKHFR
jgi:hypothetical protein